MAQERFVLEWLPKTAVEVQCEIFAKQIADGASLWDFMKPEDLTKERIVSTEAKALQHARNLVRLDEYGEIYIFRQTPCYVGESRPSWQTTERCVVTDDTTELEWVTA